MSQSIQRGDLFWANLDPTIGVEIQKRRPVVVISNNAINQYSQLVIVVPITTNLNRFSPSHVLLPKGEGGVSQDSKVLTEQIRALDKQRLVDKIGTISQQFLTLMPQAAATPSKKQSSIHSICNWFTPPSPMSTAPGACRRSSNMLTRATGG